MDLAIPSNSELHVKEEMVALIYLQTLCIYVFITTLTGYTVKLSLFWGDPNCG